jgi:hypothetical protein
MDTLTAMEKVVTDKADRPKVYFVSEVSEMEETVGLTLCRRP